MCRYPSGARDAVDALLLFPKHLSEWERRFLNSLLHRSRRYSRQIELLFDAGDKVERCLSRAWSGAA
jgi:hypothetical protein